MASSPGEHGGKFWPLLVERPFSTRWCVFLSSHCPCHLYSLSKSLGGPHPLWSLFWPRPKQEVFLQLSPYQMCWQSIMCCVLMSWFPTRQWAPRRQGLCLILPCLQNISWCAHFFRWLGSRKVIQWLLYCFAYLLNFVKVFSTTDLWNRYFWPGYSTYLFSSVGKLIHFHFWKLL